MGFYYLLLLFLGVVFIALGAMKKDVSRSVKIVIALFVVGALFIVISIVLLMPGSSDIISELLRL